MREVEVNIGGKLVKIERSPSLDSIAIGSDNLAGYLISRGFVAKESQFASELDLGSHSSIIEKLYIETKEGFIFSGKQVKPGFSMSGLIRETFFVLNVSDPQAEKAVVAHFEAEEASMTAPVERSSVVYFDRNDNMFKTSPINFGTLHSVNSSASDLLKEGKMPMIEIHTHSNDSLFSELDYFRMLTRLGRSRIPIVKSAIVLCPNIQVLALATRRTPLLGGDEAISLLEALRVNLNEDNSIVGRLKIAQELNVKLFSSTDRRHFKEFSA